MIKSDIQRLDAKRRHVNERKKQFAVAVYKQQDYPHRLNFYELPPTSEISLEDFEKWAIHRLRILAEIEACSFRNKTPQETAAHIEPLLKKYLPLSANSAAAGGVIDQRLRDER
ncbi:hypothetical protein EPUS_03930 [Endocarpon pusillum Z07020]|uniref:Uncharacterized protein n=1 Tax=Endocarpon pusillum (strain Z07020 / HMAS-L-300199) TaxID=1263415 RepID=U1GAF0_ENDPU|nr:uncharacterized protein EPUS_03930 [Endocarpon pusillum Z07020]ERF74492.1 hypothetical protein EPUS_03930 [Endocarpon pusillum Z07020]